MFLTWLLNSSKCTSLLLNSSKRTTLLLNSSHCTTLLLNSSNHWTSCMSGNNARKINVNQKSFISIRSGTKHKSKTTILSDSSQDSKCHFLSLADIFHCSLEDLNSIIVKHPDIKTMSLPLLQQKVDLLKSYGFPLSLIRDKPRPLYKSSHKELSRRLLLLKDKSLLIENPVVCKDDLFYYLGCDSKDFDAGYKKMCADLDALEGCSSKSERLAQIFNCSLDDVETMIAKYPFINTMSITLLKEKVDLLLTYNFTLSMIRNNPLPLENCSNQEISRRLLLLKDKGLLTENPVVCKDDLFYYLRCNSKDFDAGYKYLCGELDALEGCSCRSEYLQLRLNCSKEEADQLLSLYRLSHISNRKLKEVLDFFLNETKLGYEFIKGNTELFKYSVTRLQQRWKIMQLANVPYDEWVNIWCLSEPVFQEQFKDFLVQHV